MAMSWAEVETAVPELAGTVRSAFSVGKHATMATLRADGGPRISGNEVDFGDDGELRLHVMLHTRRAADLRRDPRIALHSPSVDPPEDPESWAGDAKIDALAEAGPSDDADHFVLRVLRLTHTRVAPGAQELEITVWEPGAPLRVLRRA